MKKKFVKSIDMNKCLETNWCKTVYDNWNIRSRWCAMVSIYIEGSNGAYRVQYSWELSGHVSRDVSLD